MSSIEKAIERFKKTTKFGSDELDIDFALADSYKAADHSNTADAFKPNAKNVEYPPAPFSDQPFAPKEISSNQALKPTGRRYTAPPGPHYSFNYAALAKQGFLTPNSHRNATAEEYRSLKRPILMNAFGKGAVPVERGNLLMVVSSLPGEGKTFTSFNLAMSMAMERDKTVLLVDSDVIKQSLTKLLGLEGKLGLLDVLKDNSVSLGDVIIRTDLPNLNIIPAGQGQINSTELLASEAMERVTTDLSTRYADRIVVFDAPPILATTEATVLAHFMGQILLVVEAGKTLQNIVKDAIGHLEKDKVIGLLLNKSRRSFKSEYYGYYGK